MVPNPSDPVATMVFFLIVFAAVGIVFLFFHLLMGSVIRPNKPDAEKLTIYECGEPTVGSAWIQFDLRFYVVALLFVIFDVEVAFFFPWAVVFGKANQLANMPPVETRKAAELEKLDKSEQDRIAAIEKARLNISKQLLPAGVHIFQMHDMKVATYPNDRRDSETVTPISPQEASSWAHIAFFDLLAFFAILMVGFAYVWRRGDINWVRAYAHHTEPATEPQKPAEQQKALA